jgi:hypothetical protein
MKKFIMLGFALLLIAGTAYAKDYEVKKKAGDFDVQIRIDKNPPIAGENHMDIAIKDAAGKLVTDAMVVVNYSMPAMPGMPAMNYKSDAQLKGETYKASMGLSMSGSWNVEMKITRAGKTSSLKFTVDAK